MAKQISIFLENKEGRLAHVTRILGEAGINIRVLSIADTSDFGILRIIVNDPYKTFQVLHEAGFTVSETKVLAVQVPDTPGGLADVLEQLSQENLNIEYLYAVLGSSSDQALIIFKVEDNEKAQQTFEKRGIKFLSDEELYQL